MNITIRDVAKKLNLSITTVSRALDGYGDVAEGTRQLVIKTAQEMGYIPNQAARQLRRRRTDTIGYILPTDKPRFSDPFFAEFTAGLGDEVSANGFDLLVSTAPPDSQVEQLAYQKWVHGRRVDGIVLNRIHLNDWRVQYLAQAQFPFVTLERSLDAHSYAAIEIDGRYWFRVLIDHLVSLGHQRIAYIGASPSLVIQADHFQGYLDGLQLHDLAFDANLVAEGDLTSEGGYHAGKRLLAFDNPPTAIVCVDDMTAIGVLHAARDMGRMVGQDLAVAGFDGIEGFEHTQPPLTTINLPVYRIARRLVQMLVSQVTGKPMPEHQLQIEPVLEVRQSTQGK
ncbi:MAG TPA: LacI family DNA-binding transcriptional regulator [Anaerolineales bacterium]|nr:LacI family DNA-binding transcriptional regulator [Anaerolineales bacterium]